jgi:hypothetical protein
VFRIAGDTGLEEFMYSATIIACEIITLISISIKNIWIKV